MVAKNTSSKALLGGIAALVSIGAVALYHKTHTEPPLPSGSSIGDIRGEAWDLLAENHDTEYDLYFKGYYP